MNSSGRKKAKADSIAGLGALWVPVAPRIIQFGSRIFLKRLILWASPPTLAHVRIPPSLERQCVCILLTLKVPERVQF